VHVDSALAAVTSSACGPGRVRGRGGDDVAERPRRDRGARGHVWMPTRRQACFSVCGAAKVRKRRQ